MKNILSAIKLTFLTLVAFGIVYPVIIYGIAQFSSNNGKGELLTINNKVVGYNLIGQSFTQDKYFWGRPSAVNYNAAGSGGSNKGASNQDYLQTVQARIDTFLVHNPTVKKADIPTDLVTASGSGLDPHISPEAAMIQVARIAKIRKLGPNELVNLVEKFIEKPLIGTPRIHVLKLNMALDKL
jgi:K+-transporting ATPase ATPase C chain